MRKKINILLGALIALLSGCKTQQPPTTQEVRPMVMSGPPTYFQQQEDTPLQKDTIEKKAIDPIIEIQ